MVDVDGPRLIFSKNSIRNASIAWTQRITKLSRWNSEDNKYILVAEWERNIIKSDRFRIIRFSKEDSGFVPLNDICPVTWGDYWGIVLYNRTFTGYDGKKYVWKVRGTSLKAFVIEETTQKETLVASFHRRNVLLMRKNSFVELYPGYENSLDLILFCEEKRRGNEDRQ
ncbi:hypothetical protein SCHPADRAFT_884833 [Schizopora paradoxa]|uniref:DUF6593 domain-containing protein n=1 Tax=Schizopora paradoxa TaxID=27342 RepID=A0A0H2S6Z8_9AGAM|nr:hypothetical protein SCHPADRAFT_884833 [Schizopora paradoxa]